MNTSREDEPCIEADSRERNRELHEEKLPLKRLKYRTSKALKSQTLSESLAQRLACPEPALMPCARSSMLRWTRDEEEQGKHAGAKDGEVLNDVDIGQRCSLIMKLVVEVGLRRMQRSP